MTLQEAMQALEAMGAEQNRKIYKRHGAGDNLLGVSFANLNKLQKTIRRDHALAQQLWKTGNIDARTLATMVADPARATEKEIESWIRDVRYYMLANLLSGFIGKTSFCRKKMEAWIASDEEYRGQAGWNLLGFAAMQEDSGLSDAFFEKALQAIEKRIHGAKNRARHAMNGALIAIGMRNPKLEKLALGAAARIGKVEVDHGETSCVTPDAAAYILKAAAWKRKRRT